MTDPRIGQLLDRLDSLLDRAEQLLPRQPETDWNAIAWRWRPQGYLQAIRHVDDIQPEDLLHIDTQKQALRDNTAKFLAAQPANHALLWGSRGTGKSSLIKALLQAFAQDGLRLIEVDKRELDRLPDIIEPLYDRPERFILFCDDLSFADDEPGYKSLKAALDGSVEQPPPNVRIYATSNRRHLLPEKRQDNLDTRMVDGELHHSDAVEEKISLSERFGLWLSFRPFTQEQYLEVARYWMNRLGVDFRNDEAWRQEALRFALYRGSRSGRVARQFVNHWASA